MSASGAGRADVIVVGAGHNGLVCAAYLARAGRRVLVLEARERSGGGAGERPLAPGFRVPACAHLLTGLHASVVEDLELERHGMALVRRALPTVGLAPEQPALELGPGGPARIAPDGSPTVVDARGYASLHALLAELAGVLARWLARKPPRLGTRSGADLRELVSLGLGLRGLGSARLRELLRVATTSAADLIEEHVTDPLLGGVLAHDAVLGSRLGPRSPGTVLTWLYRAALEHGQGRAAGPALPRGGMGALVEALARSARHHGAQVRTSAPVARVHVRDGAAAGVVLESGEAIEAGTVVSCLHPGETLLRLVGAEHLEVGLVRALRSLRARGACAKLNLALDALPKAPALPGERLAGRLVLAPDVDAVERAFNHLKYGEHATVPVLEAVIPSLSDPSVAPEGGHVLSAIVQFASDAPRADAGAARDALRDAALEVLETHLPGLRQRLVAVELLTPRDLEREVGLGAGHWHHLEMGFDQLFWSRPMPTLAQYRTPVGGLHLGGAGSHPGGGVCGLAGANAARAILAEHHR
jgi:phytoene dehydrogenase-like protein